MFLGDVTLAPQSEEQTVLKEDTSRLKTMDKVVIASVVISAIGVLVQVWSITRQAERNKRRTA